MKTKYSHIPEWERKRIEELTQAGSSNKRIAWELGRSTSTIGRELKRNYGHGAWWYNCERAQRLSEERRKNSKVPRISEKIWKEVFRLYNADRSPKQISGALKLQGGRVSYAGFMRKSRRGGWNIDIKHKGTF